MQNAQFWDQPGVIVARRCSLEFILILSCTQLSLFTRTHLFPVLSLHNLQLLGFVIRRKSLQFSVTDSFLFGISVADRPSTALPHPALPVPSSSELQVPRVPAQQLCMQLPCLQCFMCTRTLCTRTVFRYVSEEVSKWSG